MGKCKDCVSWKRGSGYNVYQGPLNDKYGSCNNSGFVYDTADGERTDQLVYGDYDGYSAGFDTGEDFGCVHFKQK